MPINYAQVRGEMRRKRTIVLRLTERTTRYAVASGEHIGMNGRVIWAATRDELRARGKRVPEAYVKPRRFLPWT